MGFISFNEKYYSEALQRLENKSLSPSDIYESKQLLKVLDDLSDEGYTNLNNYLENNYSCITRLRRIIENAGSEPFKIIKNELPEIKYGNTEHELINLIDALQNDAATQKTTYESHFLSDIRNYCDWIGYDNKTAYIFLLRDALLPYMYYKRQNREHLHAWMINRDFLNDITGVKNFDDIVRLPVYEALEQGYRSFSCYEVFCKERILTELKRHDSLKSLLCRLLSGIKEDNIIVVESGYCGTIPLMLCALDSRVTFRLYTTAPYLYKTYKDRIFCKRYEDIRKFETLYSQEFLLKYSSFRENRFYVTTAENQTIWEKALSEIKFFL